MEWLLFLIIAMGAGAAVLAVYEWRKGVKLREDIVLPTRGNRREDVMARTRKTILRANDPSTDDFGRN